GHDRAEPSRRGISNLSAVHYGIGQRRSPLLPASYPRYGARARRM
ncbi:MAG: hypothetical protein AVDCRST_MAG18-4185, partial [uncultured Thermomicrobiales bacterium]